MPDIKVVGIMAKPGIPHASTIMPQLVEWLKARGIEARLDEESSIYMGLTNGLRRSEIPEGAQMIIVLGGDGT
ncbi:MAG TPA: NAD(+) kinase, partial [Bryobacteraceae bacterium]